MYHNKKLEVFWLRKLPHPYGERIGYLGTLALPSSEGPEVPGIYIYMLS
jgi:hypothetical protein